MQTSDDQKQEKESDPKPLGDLLRSSPLQYLVKKAREIVSTDEAIHRLLPEGLAPHCRTINVTPNHIIVIHVDSAIWATRLRYLVPDLLDQLHENSSFSHISDIHCRVNPNFR